MLPMDGPEREMAIASKFAGIVSKTRQLADKYQDAHDFMCIALRAPNDLEKLRRLGELVYAGGGDEIVKLVEDARAGRDLKL